jgi:hypothetical protein
MAFPWSTKNERAEPEPTAVPSSDQAESRGEIGQLIGALGRVGELVAAANEKILRRLADREPHTAVAAEGAGVPASLPEKTEAVAAGLAAVRQQVAEMAAAVRCLGDQLGRGLEQMAGALAPAKGASEPEQASLSGWEKAVLGRDVAAHPALAFQRHQLLSGVLEGNAAACALAGQLLVFQAAPAERLPPLLKDLGEAYYRWQPKTRPGNTPFEEALCAWLQRTCEAAGLHNTIELVHPGERFDTARHNAATRGVEITEVHGWIVLRDNGKVYTKASVAVR